MAVNDDNYEMVPYKDILELKQELEEIKASGNPELVNSMKQLTGLLQEFTAVLKEASKGMSEESKDNLKSISQKLDAIMQQNEKIADALVAVTDMMDNNRQQETVFAPMQQVPLQAPQMGTMQGNQMPPMPMQLPPMEQGRALPDIDHFDFAGQPQSMQGMPQFPVAEKRKGLFGRFRK